MILVENVWNQMFYEHDKPPEQTPEKFIKFVDSLSSPWVGMYYDLGNHWKYGQPGEWIRAFGRRCVKMDAKGFSRAKSKFVDITSPDDDLPWADVRQGPGRDRLRRLGHRRGRRRRPLASDPGPSANAKSLRRVAVCAGRTGLYRMKRYAEFRERPAFS